MGYYVCYIFPDAYQKCYFTYLHTLIENLPKHNAVNQYGILTTRRSEQKVGLASSKAASALASG